MAYSHVHIRGKSAHTCWGNKYLVVQAVYVNMHILACSLHGTLPSSAPGRSLSGSRASYTRLLLIIQALVRQFSLLKDLLSGKVRMFSVLQQFPLRVLASNTSHLRQLCKQICCDADEVRFLWEAHSSVTGTLNGCVPERIVLAVQAP